MAKVERGTSFHGTESIAHIELKELTIETATPLLKIFKTSWDMSKVQIKQFSDGKKYYNITKGPFCAIYLLIGWKW